jgi:hypothetical protein
MVPKMSTKRFVQERAADRAPDPLSRTQNGADRISPSVPLWGLFIPSKSSITVAISINNAAYSLPKC